MNHEYIWICWSALSTHSASFDIQKINAIKYKVLG